MNLMMVMLYMRLVLARRFKRMGVNSFEDLRRHIGHKIECVCYGKKGEEPQNVSVECVTCNEVLLDFENPNKV